MYALFKLNVFLTEKKGGTYTKNIRRATGLFKPQSLHKPFGAERESASISLRQLQLKKFQNFIYSPLFDNE